MLSRAERAALVVIACAAAALLYAGWRTFWFLTDDAFISYRYISNSLLGYGYVWNPPPFQPVEGYTNFLWIVLLDVVWRLSSVAPPQSANLIALAFSFGTLALAAALTLRIPWHPNLAACRIPCVALVLLGTLGNRSFLAWTSSGLETAMFNFLVLGWLYFVLARPVNALWIFAAILSSSLLALTRPDGLLFFAATWAAIAVHLWQRPHADRLRLPWTALPAALVPIHLLWRKSFYGEWLPNTYYAKVTGAWPESGLRYAGSFVLEYALWAWIALAVFVLAFRFPLLRQALRRPPGSGPHPLPAAAFSIPSIGLLTVAAHLAYYTLIVGGDHFEYRVYSGLIPLIFVSFAWLMNAAALQARLAIALLAGFVLLSYPIPWTHWVLSQERNTRRDTQEMFIPVAPHFPAGLSAYARQFDSLQAWLIEHFVCMRHQEHKIAQQWWSENVIPGREVGQTLRPPAEEFPILPLRGGVGTTAWALPYINVIDLHGLNDRVIGRTPPPPGQPRRMAHSRVPPPGYVAAFAPNVRILAGKRLAVDRRERILTPEDIREIERVWTARTLGGDPTRAEREPSR